MKPDYLFLTHDSWAAVFFASYVAFGLAASFVFSRERGAAKGEDRDRGSRAVICIFSMLGGILAFWVPYVLPGARIGLSPAPVFWLAMVLLWSGTILYPVAALTLGKSFRTSVQLLEGQRLVTHGLYRYIRHPAYTAGILVFAGIGLATGNWFSFVEATACVLLAYAWRIRVEEQALAECFGVEFESHRKRTWAVIPLVW